MSEEIRREIIAEKVVYGMIDYIRQNDIKPGEKLPPEREMAKIFSVGRPAIREALRALYMLNIVDIRHGDGIYLSHLKQNQLVNPFEIYMDLGEITADHLFEARIVLEVEIIGLAAKRITDKQIANLEKCIKEAYEFLDDGKRAQEIDTKIHSIICDAANNPILKSTMMSIKELINKSREITGGYRELREITLISYKKIFEALKMRDVEQCKKNMRDHLLNVKKIADINKHIYENELKRIVKQEVFYGID